jgi:hypothetical protein
MEQSECHQQNRRIWPENAERQFNRWQYVKSLAWTSHAKLPGRRRQDFANSGRIFDICDGLATLGADAVKRGCTALHTVGSTTGCRSGDRSKNGLSRVRQAGHQR